LLSFPLTASAAAISITDEPGVTEEENEIMRMEVTEWYYRVGNNGLEKRLWSVTYGYWKTDWMPY